LLIRTLPYFTRQFQGFLNISFLSSLAASSQEYDQQLPSLQEVDPVPRALIDPHLSDTLADRFDISHKPECKVFDPCLNSSATSQVLQSVQPLGEGFSLADFHFILIVAYWLHSVNPTRLLFLYPVQRCPGFSKQTSANLVRLVLGSSNTLIPWLVKIAALWEAS
jgi:hypothetical protein